ncbi:MAG: hypothetical protein IKM86_01140 [Acidaminococcaceae bacterium]|nr:hypothetical protein [Acidaminococcaceae bacterium]
MKRLVSFLILLVMMTNVCLAFADGIELSKYSDNEIIELFNQIQQEIVNRKISKSAELPPGSYVVGKDIPAGTYDIYAKCTGNGWVNITIFDSQGNGKFFGTVYGEDYPTGTIKGEGTWHITLVEGDKLEVTGQATLTISAGVLFK